MTTSPQKLFPSDCITLNRVLGIVGITLLICNFDFFYFELNFEFLNSEGMLRKKILTLGPQTKMHKGQFLNRDYRGIFNIFGTALRNHNRIVY